MTLASTLALCAAVAPPTIALYVVARQRDNARATANLFKDWWLAASDRALRAEARLDLIHHQHVDAGKASHDLTDEERALRDATTERLRNSPPTPLRPRAEIEAEVAALRAARKSHPREETGRGVAHLQTAGPGFGSTPPSSLRADQRRRTPLNLSAELKGAQHG